MEYYSTIKKNEIMFFVEKLVELEIIMLGEISQNQKDKYYMFSLICMIVKSNCLGKGEPEEGGTMG
jgi:hypothetical protein